MEQKFKGELAAKNQKIYSLEAKTKELHNEIEDVTEKWNLEKNKADKYEENIRDKMKEIEDAGKTIEQLINAEQSKKS